MNPKVSVIYVNYNTSDLLVDSLVSLQENCKEVSYEIIVVDNDSGEEDKTKLNQRLKDVDQKNLRIIFSADNLGFSRANNLGSKHAKGKYLFFLNPDTLIINDVIRIFHDFLEKSDDKTASCGGNLLKGDYSPNYSYGNFPGLLYEVCSIGFGLSMLFKKYYDEHVFIGKMVRGIDIIEVPYITGADIFIRQKCFVQLNGFDEHFFMYYEETDLFMRLQRSGYKSYIIPQARIIHFEGGAVGKTSPANFNYSKLEMTSKSKLYYFGKWFPGYKLPVLKVVIFLQIVVQYLKGNMGKSFKKLLSIYLTMLKSRKKVPVLRESSL